MKTTALIKQSTKSIWNNKVRSSLTILGIVIGIAAVISLVGLGKGLQSNVTNRISNLGTTDINIQSQDPERQTAERVPGGGGPGGPGGPGGFTFDQNDTASITYEDYVYIKSLQGIELASPEETTQVAVTKSEDSDTASQYRLYGVDEDYMELEDLEITNGNSLTSEQINNSQKVVLIGADAADELFDDMNPVGKDVYIDDVKYEIVGVVDNAETEDSESNFPAFGGPNGVSQSFVTGYVRWVTQTDGENLSTITAEATSEDEVETVARGIETQLYETHDVAEDNADFSVSTSQDLLNTVSDVASSFTTTLAGIAAISLVVGGIGIMNIMLVTVTERTREIGLRRAVGAKSRHIVMQFLLEALVLTLLGGLIGVGIGLLFGSNATDLIQTGFGGRGGPGGNMQSNTEVVIDLSTILLAVGISSAIGLIFGLFPAIKAAKLDPVEALRYE